jgi:hypothetical protein
VTFGGCNNGEVEEDSDIRRPLDNILDRVGMQKIQTVANTIFPQSLWRRAKGDRTRFFGDYIENLPSYVAMEPHKNRGGLYFGRLIAFDLNHRTGERLNYIPAGLIPANGNQLEFVIQHCKPSTRISMLQTSVFDPARDHSAAAQLGFPCLQHVTFVPNFSNGTLALNAFYATQQLFAKGYGNYLGLARLGIFIAAEVGLALERVTCFIGVEKMENKPPEGRNLRALTDACAHALETENGAE